MSKDTKTILIVAAVVLGYWYLTRKKISAITAAGNKELPLSATGLQPDTIDYIISMQGPSISIGN